VAGLLKTVILSFKKLNEYLIDPDGRRKKNAWGNPLTVLFFEKPAPQSFALTNFYK